MDNANLWHLRNQIFEDLSHEDVLNCRRVCKYWNESLRRLSDVKFIQEFGERVVGYTNKKLLTIIPEWKYAAHKYGIQASMEDLENIKDSLKKLAEGKGKCVQYPVHQAARNGDVKLMEFILKTSFDINSKDDYGCTALHKACYNGQTEIAQLIIQNSKIFDIDLNAKSNGGSTAWHYACWKGQTEIVQLIIQNSKIFDIDLNAKDNRGRTALHEACFYGETEIAQLIIQNSKEFDIDLNAKSNSGSTALHVACIYGRTEIVQMILKNWKEFGIDIKAQNNDGKTALDLVNHLGYYQFKKMLEKEYSQIDITESVQNLNVE